MHKRVNLIQSTKQVFNECSNIYLREDKHWGCDLDIISQYVEKFQEPEIIDAGTGYAWHLVNLLIISSAKIKRIVGIDYSVDMLKQARKFINSISLNGAKIGDKIELKHGDILSLNIGNGMFDIALLLNNTLGNIPDLSFDKAKEKRKRALSTIKKVLRQNSFLIISVYNADKLSEEDKYGEVFELDRSNSNLDNYDLVVRFKKTGTLYYSHWFSKNEICQLLYDVGFNLLELEERKKRIVLVSQKI